MKRQLILRKSQPVGFKTVKAETFGGIVLVGLCES